MKLTDNEKFVIDILLRNPRASNTEISNKLKMTSQWIGKIRKQLEEKGVIKYQETILDYEKLEIHVHAIAMIKVSSATYKKFKQEDIDHILKPVHAIRSYALPETEITHIIIYGFSNIKEYDDYFKNLAQKFGGYVEIKQSFIFSSNSIIKSSSKDLFLEMINKLKKQAL